MCSPVLRYYCRCCDPRLWLFLRRMAPATKLERTGNGARRSQRLKLLVPVWVHSKREKAQRTREESYAVNVNVAGGMVEVKFAVQRGDLILIVHKNTLETQ